MKLNTKLRTKADAVVDRVGSFIDKVKDYKNDNPWKFSAAAVVLGLLIGFSL